MSSSAERQPRAPAWKTLGVGGVAGLVSCVLLQPMDLLKTRMQQERIPYAANAPSAGTRLVRAFHNVVETDGWRGLWRGTVPTMARNVPGVAAYFYTINELRWIVARWQIPLLSMPTSSQQPAVFKHGVSTMARLSTAGNLVTGAFARVAIGLVLNPVSIVKARFESSHYTKNAYPSLLGSLHSLYAEGGVRGFFRGFSATALRDAPYAGLYLALYEQGKQACAFFSHERTGAWWVVSASSLYAGTLATVFTHPFDILKTRMQTTPTELLQMAGEKHPQAVSSSIVRTARHIVVTDGVRAFGDGLGLRCARKAASSMIGWSIFELGNRWVSRL
mgnify:FL=1